ncbi:MAG: DUF58 domain-containing protein [Planctomycetota bacterium]
MIVPTRWALIWLTVGLGAGVLAAVDRRAVLLVVLIDASVLGWVLWQGKRLAGLDVRATRRWSGQLQAGRTGTMCLRIENHCDRPLALTVRQPWPPDVQSDAEDWTTMLAARQQVEYEVSITPRHRGVLKLPDLELDVSLPMGLAAHRRRQSGGGKVTVLPSLGGIRAYEKLRHSRALRSAGFHRQRMIGHGREFDRMREYFAGDDFRDINWKATARSGEPRTNLYQAERSRDVVICVDGGRLMCNPIGERSTLDHAVDAAMLLVHAGHDQGDRVGLITFHDRVETIIRPGTTNAPLILRSLAEFDSRPVFPSYLALVEQLRARQTHRGLIFILTDLNDPQLAADLVELMPMLVSRHVVVVVSLRDTLVDRVASGPAGDERGGVSRVLAARSISHERAERSRQLTKSGVQVLEADAQHLSLAVINHYMAIKSRQLL